MIKLCKKILLVISFFSCIVLYGCSGSRINSIHKVTGEVINVKSTAVISRDVKIINDSGKEIIIHDTLGAIGDVDLGTRISVEVNEGNYVSGDIEYFWED